MHKANLDYEIGRFTHHELEYMLELVDSEAGWDSNKMFRTQVHDKLAWLLRHTADEGDLMKCQACGEWYTPDAPDDWGTYLIELCNSCYTTRRFT
jgi:hypothetical protein